MEYLTVIKPCASQETEMDCARLRASCEYMENMCRASSRPAIFWLNQERPFWYCPSYREALPEQSTESQSFDDYRHWLWERLEPAQFLLVSAHITPVGLHCGSQTRKFEGESSILRSAAAVAHSMSALMLQAFDGATRRGTTHAHAPHTVFNDFLAAHARISRIPCCPIFPARSAQRHPTRCLAVLDISPYLATALTACHQLHRMMLRSASMPYNGMHWCRYAYPRTVVGRSDLIRAWSSRALI
ncbi:hypothetical protein EDB87DRAFT_569235 [Lactarius vividus]|nr:hypothetical protein EDB87DRAFT_569235 [Lactarius vividus]